MLDWLLVYIVVFFFVILFQYMVNFFNTSDPENEERTHNSGRDTDTITKP